MIIVLLLIFNFPIETISFSTIQQRDHHCYLYHRNNGPRISKCPRNLFHKEQQPFLTSINTNDNNINKYNSNNRNNNGRNTLLPTIPTSTTNTIADGESPSTKKKTSDANSLTKLVVLIIPLAVILTLAMNTNDVSQSFSFVSGSTTTANSPSPTSITIGALQRQRQQQQQQSELNLVLESVESMGTTILDAAIPQDATALLSVTLGESFAGLLGAIATWGVNLGLIRSSNSGVVNTDASNNTNTSRRRRSNDKDVDAVEINSLPINNLSKWWRKDASMKEDNNRDISKNKDVSPRATMEQTNTGVDLLFTEAVADSDYFITKAAATPLLGAVGMSGGMQSALTVLLASIPYQFIKFSAKAKEQKIKEDLFFDALLEKQKREKKRTIFQLPSIMNDSGFTPTAATAVTAIMGTPSSTTTAKNTAEGKDKLGNSGPVMDMEMEMGYRVDFVELFADVTKWLEYDVLMTDFGGKIKWLNSDVALNSGIESAIFGCLAAISSQIYADVIYQSSGPSAKRAEIKSRTLDSYIRNYYIKGVSAATLFGVYEAARLPITKVISNFLSGGYDSCLGSDDFDFCLETYFFANPAEATPEAQFRSFVVALVNLWNRLGDIDNLDAAVRGLAVQLYNLVSFVDSTI